MAAKKVAGAFGAPFFALHSFSIVFISVHYTMDIREFPWLFCKLCRFLPENPETLPHAVENPYWDMV
jgi:hypothetical protein